MIGPRVFALVPAAGQSSRMGRPKLLLPLGGRTVIEHVIAAFRAAGVERVLVVVPPGQPELAEVTGHAGADVLLLEAQTTDMRATVEHGLAWLEEQHRPTPDDGWLLAPADHPTLSAPVVRLLLGAWARPAGRSILIPTCGGKRGHPALIGWDHVPAIRAWPGGKGLNDYLRGQLAETELVETGDEAVLLDLDTPADYERLRQRGWPAPST
jgi:CTP:molybdopterin cytidylyltransferase MocA